MSDPRIHEALGLVRELAQDAVDCGDGNCPDHDVPILAAVTLAAEIDRLRRIEGAARALLVREYGWNGDMPYWNWTGPAYHEVRALRAALEEKP
jgi:hypothetical protein